MLLLQQKFGWVLDRKISANIPTLCWTECTIFSIVLLILSRFSWNSLSDLSILSISFLFNWISSSVYFNFIFSGRVFAASFKSLRLFSKSVTLSCLSLVLWFCCYIWSSSSRSSATLLELEKELLLLLLLPSWSYGPFNTQSTFSWSAWLLESVPSCKLVTAGDPLPIVSQRS